MKKYIRYIIAAVIAFIAMILVVEIAKLSRKKSGAREIVSFVVSNKEKLAELVTYRYSRDTIIYETRQPSRFVARFTDAPDTIAVFLARPVICAGIDLGKLDYDDISISGDTLFISLPSPEILDLYLNHSDITQVYSSWDWKLDDKLGSMAENAKEGLRRDSLRMGILQKAGTHAERSLSSFLSTMCRMTVIARIEEHSGQLTLPSEVALPESVYQAAAHYKCQHLRHADGPPDTVDPND